MDTTHTPEPLSSVLLTPLATVIDTYIRRDPDDYDLNAPYQRESVWDLPRRQALIKSILEGVPVGSVIVSILPLRADGASYRVIDGKQRIETVRAFTDSAFEVPSWWFPADDLTTTRSADTTVTFSDLSISARRRFVMSPLPQLQFHGETEFCGWDDETGRRITRHRSTDELIETEADLYLRLNFGGVPQTDDDAARAAAVAKGMTDGQ